MKSIITRLGTLLLSVAVITMVGCTDYSADIQALDKEFHEYAEKTDIEIAALKEALAKLDGKVQDQYTAKEDFADLAAQVTGIHQNLEDAKSDLADAISSKADQETIEAALTDITESLEDLKTAIDDASKKNEELAKALSDLKTVVDGIITDITNINITIEDLETDFLEKFDAIEGSLKALESKVDTLISDLDTLEQNFADYQDKTDAELEKIAGQFADLDKYLTDQFGSIKDQLAALASNDNAISESIAAHADKIMGIINEINANLSGKDASLQEQLDKVAAQYEALEKLVDELSGEDEELASQLETLKKDLAQLRAEFDAAYTELVAADAKLQEQINGLVSDFAAAQEELKNLAGTDAALQADIDALKAAYDDLAGNGDLAAKLDEITAKYDALVEALQKTDADNKAELEGKITDLQNQFNEASKELIAADGNLQSQIDDLAGKYDEVLAKLDNIPNVPTTDFESLIDELSAACEAADKAIADAYAAADAELKKQIEEAVAALNGTISDLASSYEDVNARLEAVESSLAELQGVISGLQSVVDGLAEKVTALRSIVLVPETVYNGTKAVKFHRMDGENVLKTFAEVSFHFNPAEFDLNSAEYEIVAENVEFMTKADAAENDAPAIKVVGKPFKKDGKVVFLLERAEGAGNMFALKVTLADGTVIYSEYAAIIDEFVYCEADATVTVDVQRLMFELPTIKSLSEFIALIQNAGDNFEELKASIFSINEAYEAVKNGNIIKAMDIIKHVPGFKTKTVTVTGYGYTKELVKPITAVELFEALKSSLDLGFGEFMNKWEDILGAAGSLGEGNEILEGLEGAFGNSGITDTMAKLEEAIKNFDAAETSKNLAENALAAAKEYAASEKAALNDKKAKYESESRKLEDIKNAHGVLSKEYIAQAATVTAALTDYKAAESAVSIAEAAIPVAEKTLADAEKVVEGLKAKVDEYTQAIKEKAEEYLENSELGAKLKELENALAEQNWEMQKSTTSLVAQMKAVKIAGEEAIADYNALNQQIVDEFNDSILGKVLSLIETQEATDMFEELGLTELHTSLKQLPEIITALTKYYPAIDLDSVEDFKTVIDKITGTSTTLIQNAIDSISKGQIPELNLDSEYLDVNTKFVVEYELAK